MTYNEFKMCCILFCKTFDGKKYGEVVKDCYDIDENIIISLNACCIIDEYSFFITDHCIFDYTVTDELNICTITNNLYFKTYEDFLNHFKITFEDIVC